MVFAGVDYRRDGWIEGEGFAPAIFTLVHPAGPSRKLRDLPIHTARIVIAGLHRRADVRIDPEWPKGIIQVKRNEFREGKAIVECGRCN